MFQEAIENLAQRGLWLPVYRAVETRDPSNGYLYVENFRNGETIGGRALTCAVVTRRRFLPQEQTPDFVNGRLYELGLGGQAYKLVYIPEEKPDEVIKQYYHQIYSTIRFPEDAQRKAQIVVDKINLVHQAANTLRPGIILPWEMIVYERSLPNGHSQFEVWERQQRALQVNIRLLGPRTAYRLSEEINEIVEKTNPDLLRRLLEDPRFGRNSYDNRPHDEIALSEIHWDDITKSLVSLDCVDLIRVPDSAL